MKFKVQQKNIVAGLLAGVAEPPASAILGPFGSPAADLLIGGIQGNDTLQTLGALKAGRVLGAMLPGFLGGGGAEGALRGTVL